MHFTRSGFIVLALATGAVLGHRAPFLAAGTQDPSAPLTREQVQTLLADWGQEARTAAEAMLEKYGTPTEATASMLLWDGNGPWLRTIVYKEEVEHNFPKPHHDVLEQFVSFRVPPEKFSELAQYDGSVICERTKGEISARCDKEEMNFLALNLAHDIIEGKRDVEEARQYYADVASRFMAGEQHPYTRGLVFQAMRPGVARDPDEQLEPSVRAAEAGAPQDDDDR